MSRHGSGQMGGVSRPGPALPAPLWKHCLIKVNSTHMFMAGGEDNVHRSDRAYLLNLETWQWTRLPDMKRQRSEQGCAVLDNDKVIVVGGFRAFGFEPRSEILDLATLTWSEGPLDPEIYYEMTLVPYGDTVLTVETGPLKSTMMKLDRERNEFVEFMDVEAFNGGSVIPVPNDYPVSCMLKG